MIARVQGVQVKEHCSSYGRLKSHCNTLDSIVSFYLDSLDSLSQRRSFPRIIGVHVVRKSPGENGLLAFLGSVLFSDLFRVQAPADSTWTPGLSGQERFLPRSSFSLAHKKDLALVVRRGQEASGTAPPGFVQRRRS